MSSFKPIPAPEPKVGPEDQSTTTITATVTLRGRVADMYEEMVRENNLNRSKLLKQMVYHCLGYSYDDRS